jgi:hypothetical protein
MPVRVEGDVRYYPGRHHAECSLKTDWEKGGGVAWVVQLWRSESA